MVNSLRGLLRRRNQQLQSGQPARRDYELSDFNGTATEGELYGHLFVQAALLEDHCLTASLRPVEVPAGQIIELENQSRRILVRFRDYVSAHQITASEYNAGFVMGTAPDRRVVLMETLTQGLEEQDSLAEYVAREALAAMRLAFDDEAHYAA